MGNALKEIDCYVLPTVGNYSAYVNVDIDKFSDVNRKMTYKLKINIYSPDELDEGEMAIVGGELNKEWGKYIIEREQARKFFSWFKILAPVEIILISGAIAVDLLALPPPTNYLRAGWDLFFWGLILGFTGIIPGIRSLRYRKREKRAGQLLKNWRETELRRGIDVEKMKRVEELRNHFSKMDGREVKIYDKLKDYSKETRFMPAYDFYRWKIKDLTEEESFYTKYLPSSFKRKMSNFLFGVKVESPKIVAPVKNMDKG